MEVGWGGMGTRDRSPMSTVSCFMAGATRGQGPEQLPQNPEELGVVSPKDGELQPGGLVGRWHP